MGVDIRLSLIRQLAEAVKFAHGKGVIHRALSPQSILVSEAETNRPRIRILNWQAGHRVSSTTSANALSETLTVHPDQLMEDATLLYMSPEVLRYADATGGSADVFSLGAISYHILTGKPPASSLMALRQKLLEQKGLDISSVLDGSGSELCVLIQDRTNPDVLTRFQTIDDFLEQLQLVEDEFTEPKEKDCAFPFLIFLSPKRGSTIFMWEHPTMDFTVNIPNLPKWRDSFTRKA
jgi:serine/threonine protein kinase